MVLAILQFSISLGLSLRFSDLILTLTFLFICKQCKGKLISEYLLRLTNSTQRYRIEDKYIVYVLLIRLHIF